MEEWIEAFFAQLKCLWKARTWLPRVEASPAQGTPAHLDSQQLHEPVNHGAVPGCIGGQWDSR